MNKIFHGQLQPESATITGISMASTNFKKRLEARRHTLKLSQRDLANMVGVSVNTIQSYEKGNLPRGHHFLDVAKALKCSLNWLTGMDEQGECLPADNGDGPSSFQSADRSEKPVSLFRPPWLELAHGGFNLPIGLSFPRSWLADKASALENIRLIKVNGAAMAPTLNNGDLALIDLGRKDIRQACLYCLKIDEHYSINRLEIRPGRQLRLISDNYKLSPAFEAPADQVDVVGRVIWASRMF